MDKVETREMNQRIPVEMKEGLRLWPRRRHEMREVMEKEHGVRTEVSRESFFEGNPSRIHFIQC